MICSIRMIRDHFKASSGWLWHFCSQHNMRKSHYRVNSCLQMKVLSSLLDNAIEYDGLILEQVYNFSDTGLCYQMIPNKTLATILEKGANRMKNTLCLWLVQIQPEVVSYHWCSSTRQPIPTVLEIWTKLKPFPHYHFEDRLEQDPLKVSFHLMSIWTVDWCEAGLNVYQTGSVWKGLYLPVIVTEEYLNFFQLASPVHAISEKAFGKYFHTYKSSLLDNAPAHPDVSTLESDDKMITASS